MAEIRLAESEEERLAVYRFRYAVYVEEMGLDESYADHDRKIIKDTLDGPQAMLLAAWDGDRVVGTTRTNLVRNGGIGNYLEYYRLTDRPHAELQDTSISTRIMIHPQFRRTPLTVRLTCDCFRWMLEQGVKTDYCDCEPEVVKFFTGLGYKEQFADFYHPEFGLGSVMRLDVHDFEHLAKVRSPLRRVLAKWLEDREKIIAPLAGSCPT
jgi:hypothetical protein